jgi:hypothetical protein
MAVKTQPEEPEEPDPYKDFSLAEYWAFIHKTQGASALRSHFSDFDDPEIRKVLHKHALGDVELERELLIDIADELSLLGLTKVAAVCLQEAERRPSKFDRPNEWSVREEKYWLQHMKRQRRHWEAKRRQRLSQRSVMH